ncbi:hypothetical protein Q9966_014856 [Columba livia]|nr:hypothetical protein Q9966_014856 [Columba livia]
MSVAANQLRTSCLRKVKALKASTLLLLLSLFSFGVYQMGRLGALTPWSTADLSETLPLPDQLCKLQEQLYHLRWSAKDVADRALQEGVKQAKLPGVTGRAVHEIINQALEKLEEMQVPMPDYALKSAGAAVIQSRTFPSLRTAKAKVFWYSLPVMDYMRSTELILEPDNHRGNCWPFPGSQGHVFIKLSMPVIPRAVTMAHVSGTAFHGESISGAPKDFAVYGSKEEHEEQGTFLGQFTFLATRNPSQTFQLKVCFPPPQLGTMKVLKATTLVLLLGIFSFGIYHFGQLGKESLWSTAAQLQDLSKTLSLPDQLHKLQEQLYHLRWSTKDVAEQALQEGVKQAKLPGFTGRAVQEIINQALENLVEIQVPMPDYALKSAGAAVIHSRTSPSLRNAKAKLFFYSLPLMDYMRSPELILEPENFPGNCWPFPGSQGHVFIKLSVPVIPRAVTMDHVSGTAFHRESISGAPKDFAVYGFKEEHEEQGTFLGQFTFLAALNPSQTFQLKRQIHHHMVEKADVRTHEAPWIN